MRDYLLLTLAAPMASFGGLAVGERRPSENRPTKSQMVGLIASALGIERAEEDKQRALVASLGYAVRVDDPGLPASDYHTAQAAKDASVNRRRRKYGPLETRRDELACDDIKTVLSIREYRTGVLAVVVLWLRQAGPASLADMRDSLAQPHFALSAGRRSFPLMLPCRPELHSAETIEDALEAYVKSRKPELKDFEERLLGGRLPRNSARPTLYADVDAALATPSTRIDQRRDEPETRAKWGFGLRDERVVNLPRKVSL